MRDNKFVQLNWPTIRQYLFYFLIFIIPWQTRWIIRDPYLGGEVWEYGRISLYGWDIVLVILVAISLPVIWQEVKNIKLKLGFNPAVGGVAAKATKNQNDSPQGHYGESAWGGRRGNLWGLLCYARNDNIYIFFFLLLLSLTSILWSSDKLLALTWSLRLLEGGLLWLLVKALKPKLFVVCWSLVAAGTLQALWAIWQFVTQTSFANKWLGVAVHPLTQGGTSVVMNEYGRWLRAYAGQVHPNVLGGLLVIALLATVYLYVVKKSEIRNSKSETTEVESSTFTSGHANPNNKLPILDSSFQILSKQNAAHLLVALYIIQLIALFFSFSRGAWLALLLTLIFWWWLERKSVIASEAKQSQDQAIASPLAGGRGNLNRLLRRSAEGGTPRNDILKVIFISGLTVIILGAIYWQPLSGRFTGQSTLEQQSIEDRRGSIKQSSQILSSQWLLGTGIGNYTAQLAQNIPGLKAWRYQPVHNIFLLVFTELGIVGLLLFLWILWRAVWPPPVGWHNSLFIIPVLVTAQFDHYWWTAPSMFLFFWLMISGWYMDHKDEPLTP